MKSLLLVLLVALTPFSLGSQTPVKSEEPKPIAVPSNLQMLIQNADLKLKNAQLERANLDLQIRIILKIPMDFVYNEQTLSYEAPKKDDSKK